MSFFMASKLWDEYIRKLAIIYDDCRMDIGSGHRDAKTTVKAEGGGAYPFEFCDYSLRFSLEGLIKIYYLYILEKKIEK